LKKYILLIVIAFACFKANAQGADSYHSYGIGFGVSGARPMADLKKQFNDMAFNANLTYFYNRYVPIVLEFQVGKLRGGGNTIAEDKDTRRFENKYKALMFHIDYQLGDAIDDYNPSGFMKFLKNLYGGIGAGVIFNKVDANRLSAIEAGYVFPGKDKSNNLIVPLRIGYEIKVYDEYDTPILGIDIGYQHNVIFGEGLDGYDDPTFKFKNNALDQYRQLTIGLRYNFGRIQ